jgi:hypothetical protein
VGVALVVGLLALPWLVRRRPALVPTLGALAGGLALFCTFGDPHERHFIAVIAPAVAIACAPLGLLAAPGRLAPARHVLAAALALAMAAWGVAYTHSWRFDVLPSTWATPDPIARAFGGLAPHRSSAFLGRMLWVAPLDPRTRAPAPDGLHAPFDDVLDALVDARSASDGACSGRVWVKGRGSFEDAVRTYLLARGQWRIRVLAEPDAVQLGAQLSALRRTCAEDAPLFRVVDGPAPAPEGWTRLGEWPYGPLRDRGFIALDTAALGAALAATAPPDAAP